MNNKNQCRSCANLLDGAFCVNKEARDTYMIGRTRAFAHGIVDEWRKNYACQWKVKCAPWWLRTLNKLIAFMVK